MKITKLEIENLLSFSEKQSIEPDRFNLFIGPNNEGKSNVLKGSQFIKLILRAYVEHSQDKNILSKPLAVNFIKGEGSPVK